MKHARTTAAAGALALAACTSVDLTPAPAPAAAAVVAAPAQPVASQAAPAAEPADPARFRCDGGLSVRMAQVGDLLQVDGVEGVEGVQLLLRDAGGVGPQQTVWSNERLRIELGLGDGGDEASVHRLGADAASWRCRRG